MADSAFNRRWQQDAYRALGRLLDLDSLPVITWTIPISGALVGDIDSLTSTPTEQRAAFEAWAIQLGADVVPERTDSAGTTHLYAKFQLPDRGRPGGAIRATVYPPVGDEGGG